MLECFRKRVWYSKAKKLSSDFAIENKIKKVQIACSLQIAFCFTHLESFHQQSNLRRCHNNSLNITEKKAPSPAIIRN